MNTFRAGLICLGFALGQAVVFNPIISITGFIGMALVIYGNHENCIRVLTEYDAAVQKRADKQ